MSGDGKYAVTGWRITPAAYKRLIRVWRLVKERPDLFDFPTGPTVPDVLNRAVGMWLLQAEDILRDNQVAQEVHVKNRHIFE